jgi:hypothetical protein
MKTKSLLLGIAVLLAGSGMWFARAAWRAHRQIVTLNVRQVPLADVLRKLEWQTRQKIRAERNLDARITLHVTDKPLAYVLDRLAEQAGAHWSKLYAVYNSPGALKALDGALRADGKIEPAGWTKIAPKPPSLDHASPGPMTGRPGQIMMFRRMEGGPMVMQNPKGEVEAWSPEEMVMEGSLITRYGSEQSQEATAQAAAETARKLKAKWATYLAMTKSSMGVGFGPPPLPGSDPLKRDPNDRFAKLTPEQRVQRARQRLEFNAQ